MVAPYTRTYTTVDEDGVTSSFSRVIDKNELETTDYRYFADGTLRQTYTRTTNASGKLDRDFANFTSTYSYELWDSYKQSSQTNEGDAKRVRRWLLGTTTSFAYNSNGHIQSTYDHIGNRTISYINNQNGQTLERY